MPTPPWTRIGADESCPVILPVDSGDVASLNASAPWRVCTTRDEPSSEAIVGAWHDTAPNAAVIASPSAAEALVAAIGAPALARLHAVVAIGRTTAEALTRHGVPSLVAGHTDFGEVASHAGRLSRGRGPAMIDSLDRTFVECSALGFQSVVTSILAIACYLLWRRQRGRALPDLVAGLGGLCHSPRLHVRVPRAARHDLAVPAPGRHRHQRDAACWPRRCRSRAASFSGASTCSPSRRRWPGRGSPSTAWAACWWPASPPRCCSPASPSGPASCSGAPASGCRATPRRCWRAPSSCGGCITWTIPCCAGFGAAVLYGVFADVLFLFAIGLGLLFVVLSTERERLAARSSELEQLTRLMLRVQEDERRRIARELHDEAGQVLTAVKIELELDGRHEAGAMVGRALAQVRDLSNLLRPSALDDLGLAAALRALADDFSTRTRIAVTLDLEGANRQLVARCRSGDLPRRAGGPDQRRPPRARLRSARAGERRRSARHPADRGQRTRRGGRRQSSHGLARDARTHHRARRTAVDRQPASPAACASTRDIPIGEPA